MKIKQIYLFVYFLLLNLWFLPYIDQNPYILMQWSLQLLVHYTVVKMSQTNKLRKTLRIEVLHKRWCIRIIQKYEGLFRTKKNHVSMCVCGI